MRPCAIRESVQVEYFHLPVRGHAISKVGAREPRPQGNRRLWQRLLRWQAPSFHPQSSSWAASSWERSSTSYFPRPYGPVCGFGYSVSSCWPSGLGLGAWSFRTFARHKTPPGPWAPTVALVQDGPYGFSRNPIYLSFALEYLGFSCIFNYLAARILFIPVVLVADLSPRRL